MGPGERNKAEYLESRIKRVDPENRLLSGYDPIVRNVVTHAGSHGVVYSESAVLFRDIKRGVPAVVNTVEWSHDTLISKIVRLYECISIDAAVNVFGVDCGELLLKDDEKQHYSVSELFDSSPVVGVSVSSECDSITKGAERNLVGSTP